MSSLKEKINFIIKKESISENRRRRFLHPAFESSDKCFFCDKELKYVFYAETKKIGLFVLKIGSCGSLSCSRKAKKEIRSILNDRNIVPDSIVSEEFRKNK